jgi:REP element-mobilizing transposase RayT
MLPRPVPRPPRPRLRLVTDPGGSFFLTLCAASRDPVFGWVTGGAFLPSPLGRLVRECWLSLPVLQPQCGLDAFSLMPDHFHALVHFRPAPGTRGGLGTAVSHFKGAVTAAARRDHLIGPGPLWQRGYFERGVRDERMLTTIREYILRNALREAVGRQQQLVRSEK